MRTFASLFAYAALTAGLAGPCATDALAAKGEDFPGTTCTCQGCKEGGGDVVGDCGTVCKGKTVFSKGSEPHDYCKATGKTLTGNTLLAGMALVGLEAAKLAESSKVEPSTISGMLASGKEPVRADAATVDKVIHALKANGVEITESGVQLVKKPKPSHY